MRKILLMVCVSLFSSVAISQPELKGSPQDLRGFLYPNEKVVTIYGEAEEKAYSDKAIVSLVITTENKLFSVAISDNGSLRARLTQSLIAAGIPADTIKSSKFSSSPQYGWFAKKPLSYKVVNRMAISITEEDQLKEVAAVADNNQEVELSDTVFEHSKKDEYNDLVKSKALEKILKQKGFYEKSLGVKLSPIGIRDSNIRQRATSGALRIEEVIVTAQKRSKSYQDTARSVRASNSKSESSFDEVVYEASLSVDFKIQ